MTHHFQEQEGKKSTKFFKAQNIPQIYSCYGKNFSPEKHVLFNSCLLIFNHTQEEGISFVHTADFSPANTMDRWIISFTQSLVFFMKEEMASEFMPYLSGYVVTTTSSINACSINRDVAVVKFRNVTKTELNCILSLCYISLVFLKLALIYCHIPYQRSELSLWSEFVYIATYDSTTW